MINLVAVSKTFYTKKANKIHEFTAVHPTNLTVNAGEIFGIIGASGAGKSTLIRCVNLLERPTGGQVFVDGVELTTLSDAKVREYCEKKEFSPNFFRRVVRWGGFLLSRYSILLMKCSLRRLRFLFSP